MGSEVIIRNNIPILNEAILKGFAESLVKGGLVFEAKMAEQVASGMTPPPLKPATIAAKGSSSTLVDTGEMLSQITSEVRDGGKSVVVGVVGSRAGVASVMEFGCSSKNIPERSFIRRTANSSANRAEANEEVITVMRAAIKEAAIK